MPLLFFKTVHSTESLLVHPRRWCVALHVPGNSGTATDTTGISTISNYKGRANIAGTGRFGGTALNIATYPSYAGFNISPIPNLIKTDFCIECWASLGSGQIFGAHAEAGTYDKHLFLIQNATTKTLRWFVRPPSSFSNAFSVDYTTPANTLTSEWNHIAVTCLHNNTTGIATYTLYLNGVSIHSFEVTGANTVLNAYTSFVIMGAEFTDVTPHYGLNGNISDFRVTVGSVRYPGNFSIPTSYFPTS